MSDVRTGPQTLGIDIGGTGLKAAVLDPDGRMVDKRARVRTPSPSTPAAVLEALTGLVEPLPRFDRISIGCTPDRRDVGPGLRRPVRRGLSRRR